jgi:hypothetical protein
VWWALMAAYATPRLLGGRVDRKQADVYNAYRMRLGALVDARALGAETAPPLPY